MKKIQQIKSKKQVANIAWVKVASLKITTLLFTMMSVIAFGQNTTDFKTAIHALTNSSNASDRATAIHMKKMAYELNSTLFIDANGITTLNDDTPICAVLEDTYGSTLYTNNPKFAQLEFITITVSDPSNIQTLDINMLSHLTSLKYIHFVLRAECTNDQINKLAKCKNSSVKVYYSIEIPK